MYSLVSSNTFSGRNLPCNHTANGEFSGKQSLYQIGFSNNFLIVLTCTFFRRLALPRAARSIWRSKFTALTQKSQFSERLTYNLLSASISVTKLHNHACRTEVDWGILKWNTSVQDEYLCNSYDFKITFSSKKFTLYKTYNRCTLKDLNVQRNVEN